MKAKPKEKVSKARVGYYFENGQLHEVCYQTKTVGKNTYCFEKSSRGRVKRQLSKKPFDTRFEACEAELEVADKRVEECRRILIEAKAFRRKIEKLVTNL